MSWEDDVAKEAKYRPEQNPLMEKLFKEHQEKLMQEKEECTCLKGQLGPAYCWKHTP